MEEITRKSEIIYTREGPLKVRRVDKFSTDPDTDPVKLPIHKCVLCNQPMVPTDKVVRIGNGALSREVHCTNPTCANNPNSEAYQEWLRERSMKRKMDKKIVLRHNVWRF